MVGEGLPDFAVVGLDRPAIPPRHAERLQRHALRVEHAEDVVVGDDQQIGRAAERVVRVGEHARVDVAVRADQRQARHLPVEVLGDLLLARIGAEEAVGREKRVRFGTQRGDSFDLNRPEM